MRLSSLVSCVALASGAAAVSGMDADAQTRTVVLSEARLVSGEKSLPGEGGGSAIVYLNHTVGEASRDARFCAAFVTHLETGSADPARFRRPADGQAEAMRPGVDAFTRPLYWVHTPRTLPRAGDCGAMIAGARAYDRSNQGELTRRLLLEDRLRDSDVTAVNRALERNRGPFVFAMRDESRTAVLWDFSGVQDKSLDRSLKAFMGVFGRDTTDAFERAEARGAPVRPADYTLPWYLNVTEQLGGLLTGK